MAEKAPTTANEPGERSELESLRQTFSRLRNEIALQDNAELEALRQECTRLREENLSLNNSQSGCAFALFNVLFFGTLLWLVGWVPRSPFAPRCAEWE